MKFTLPVTFRANRKVARFDLTLHSVRNFLQIDSYADVSGEGFQRDEDKRHTAKLVKAMLAGEYTPCDMKVGIDSRHRDNIQFLDSGSVEITLDESTPLLLLDGGHRLRAMNQIVSDKSLSQEVRDRWINEPIEFQIFLDEGHTQTDFLNLQKGKPVGTTLIRAIEDRANPDASLKRAKEVAHLLHENPNSHLFRIVGFDQAVARSQGFNTLSATTPSNLGSSLVGGTRACPNRDPQWLADVYVAVYQALSDRDELKPYMVPGGTKGATKFLIAIGNMLAWRAEFDEADPEDHLPSLVEAIDEISLSSGWSATDMRSKLYEFALAFFRGLEGATAMSQGLPTAIFEAFPHSTFGIKSTKPDSKEAGQPQSKSKILAENKPLIETNAGKLLGDSCDDPISPAFGDCNSSEIREAEAVDAAETELVADVATEDSLDAVVSEPPDEAFVVQMFQPASTEEIIHEVVKALEMDSSETKQLLRDDLLSFPTTQAAISQVFDVCESRDVEFYRRNFCDAWRFVCRPGKRITYRKKLYLAPLYTWFFIFGVGNILSRYREAHGITWRGADYLSAEIVIQTTEKLLSQENFRWPNLENMTAFIEENFAPEFFGTESCLSRSVEQGV